MKKYVVGVVLTPDLQEVLLLLRSKTPYKGLLNGVGGKIEQDESPQEAMVRELSEETGISLDRKDCIFTLCTIFFPNQIELHAFGIVLSVKRDIISNHSDEGILRWLNIADQHLLDASNPSLAGEGNLSYFIQCTRVVMSEFSS